MPTPEPPAGLAATGQHLWDAVTGPYVLTPAELATLGEAARTADELDRLEQAVRALPELTSTGSTGQLKPHPLLAEVRAHRQLLERLTTALALPGMWIKTKEAQQPSGTRAERLLRGGNERRRAMAQWKRRDNDGVPAELLTFDPDAWVFGASSYPGRLQMALDAWHQARWEWIVADPRRTIDGDDVIVILYERCENKASAAR